MTIRPLVTLALALIAIPALAAPPSAAERTMIATIDAEQQRTLALLERAVRENMTPKDIKAAIKTWRADWYRT